MYGLATFLLGSALGVVLGYLGCKKGSRKGPRDLPEPSSRVSSATLTAPAEVPPVPVSTSQAPVAAAPAETLPVATPAVLEAPLPAEPPVQIVPDVPAVVAVGTDREGDRLVASAPGLSTPDVVVVSDIFEEPLPGFGREPSGVVTVDEATIEEFLPVVPEEFERYEPPEIGIEPVDLELAPPIAARGESEAETAEFELEVTGLDTAPAQVEAEVAEVETGVAPHPGVPTAPMPAGVEADIIPASITADLEDMIVFEPLPEVLEPPTPVEVVEPQPISAGPVAAEDTGPIAVVAPVDDLRARIEETRRRIRRELEQPFVAPGEVQGTGDRTISTVVPEMSEAAPPQPAPTESADALGDVVAKDDGLQTAGDEGVDYDAMKSRIEMTRSRLKAKAFDAMMMGEAALLARDPDGAELKRAVAPALDSEIDQTIETGLREEED